MAGQPAIHIPIARARELFTVVRNGKWHLVWRCQHGPTVRGSRAGHYDKRGRYLVGIDYKHYLGYRVIWCLVTGVQIPADMDIDHKNGDVLDNRFCNLRLVSNQQNQENRRRASKNNLTTGLLGVCRLTNGRFRASIQVCKVRHHIGTFTTADDAHQAYVTAKRALHMHSTL